MDRAAYIRERMRPLLPVESTLAAKLPPLKGIALVAFDIYGTLLISAAGEPGGNEESDSAEAAFFAEKFRVVDESPSDVLCAVVRRHQDIRRRQGVEFPEVEIREVWKDVFAELGLPGIGPYEMENFALEHECVVNPVWMMPRAREVLDRLRKVGLKLGIVSNAQFYTLPVMEGLFGDSLDGMGFESSLRIFSFEEREGKPSQQLFARLVERAAAFGITAKEILYLGNDLSKDVIPARACGMKTGLFAGDARSLRLGLHDAESASAIADAVLTDLSQLSIVLNLK